MVGGLSSLFLIAMSTPLHLHPLTNPLFCEAMPSGYTTLLLAYNLPLHPNAFYHFNNTNTRIEDLADTLGHSNSWPPYFVTRLHFWSPILIVKPRLDLVITKNCTTLTSWTQTFHSLDNLVSCYLTCLNTTIFKSFNPIMTSNPLVQ